MHAFAIFVLDRSWLRAYIHFLPISLDENRATIARAGGVDATVSALKRHINNPGVQEAGCAALRHLAYNNGND